MPPCWVYVGQLGRCLTKLNSIPAPASTLNQDLAVVSFFFLSSLICRQGLTTRGAVAGSASRVLGLEACAAFGACFLLRVLEIIVGYEDSSEVIRSKLSFVFVLPER